MGDACGASAVAAVSLDWRSACCAGRRSCVGVERTSVVIGAMLPSPVQMECVSSRSSSFSGNLDPFARHFADALAGTYPKGLAITRTFAY